jgi:DEAD/DEAH box helicase domain-containing protein
MIPALVARQIREQVKHYLTATFHFRDLADRDALERFIEDDRRGIFKGPWLQLHRPFVRVDSAAQIPLTICPKFTPYRHQWQAWQRLSTQDKEFPQATLITTGTGSGKTECFLYPVLDHCYRHRGQPGIKALILYPMNALASDQERRFAKEIYEDTRLHGIRVGLFTGRSDGSKGTSSMGRDHGISNQDILRDNPPDILLTNYKMLDYLLMRPSDRGLWQHNEPGAVAKNGSSNPLKFIILDELHTYDGAQGADVACLLRRVKERLAIPRGQVGVIGTSATIDDTQARYNGDDSGGRIDMIGSVSTKLLHFASAIFEEDFTEQSVIGESREDIGRIVNKDTELEQNSTDFQVPSPAECEPLPEETAEKYAQRQATAWGVPHGQEKLKESITTWLRSHPIFRVMLELFEKENVVPLTALVERLAESFIDIRKPVSIENSPEESSNTHKGQQKLREALVHSFLALVASAHRDGRPFISMRAQVWLRELRRLGRVVSGSPRFAWLDESDATEKSLPAFNCRECGTSGWVGLKSVEHDNKIGKAGVEGHCLSPDPALIYRAFFARGKQASPDIVVIAPYQAPEGSDPELPHRVWHLHPKSLVLRRGEGECPLTGELESVKVMISEAETTTEEEVDTAHRCPYCKERSVLFIGAQGATLASVAIDEMFGTPLNNDAKLLAFTDSVQDASHRAGFFTARTYNFTLRTALCAAVDAAPCGMLPLQDSANAILEFWKSSPRLASNGGLKEVVATLMPPDLREYKGYLEYRNGTPQEANPGPLFMGEFLERLQWEVCSQFSLLLTRGRTLEFCGATVLGWHEEVIARVLDALVVAVEGVDPTLALRSRLQFHRWLLGVLYRGRARGGLGHHYLNSFAKDNYWGKRPFGKSVEGRDVYPPAHPAQTPKLLGLWMNRSSDNFVRKHTAGGRFTWYQQWTMRALEYKGGVTAVNDVLTLLLKIGEEQGLFECKFKESNEKKLYTINPDAAVLYSAGQKWTCNSSKSTIVLPANETAILAGGPSYDYYARSGIFEVTNFDERELYYQNRYRKNIPRRVVAAEHTGLLATEKREQLEKDFGDGTHLDDPNVITCTSTLEMGIDIGDLSSTMLCSIPPTTSNYLQRIGRAGRKTGSALIVSIVNQRPHDLFFYGRPLELLRGSVNAPGCWLDAAAVLARQYFGFCLDSATAKRVYTQFPKSAGALLEDLNSGSGVVKALFDWLEQDENLLQERFLTRFAGALRENTKRRFREEVAYAKLHDKIQRALAEFSGMLGVIKNSLERLSNSTKTLEPNDEAGRQEIGREQRQLKGRQQALSRVLSYELLCDHGLLPNYAFPERGVPFYGVVYRANAQNEEPHTVELVRGASTALRELAPGNFFYTDHKKFEIQRLYIGREQESIIEKWYFCANCSFIAREDQAQELHWCPQCNVDGFNARGHHHAALEFSRSQASSYMEYNEAYAGDTREERESQFYNLVMSFDTTTNQEASVVGCTTVTFGMEYRPYIVAREFNTGYSFQRGDFKFDRRELSSEGFKVCADCGATEGPKETLKVKDHARSCTGRKKADKATREGKEPMAQFSMVNPYLYRDLRSEGIRLLVPFSDERDIETLKACVTLGLRLRFEGNPNHLLVRSQTVVAPKNGLERNYLVLMDAVPGGTGFLKSLFEGAEEGELPGSGLIDVFRRAKRALEECECTRLPPDDLANDTDGCYQCLRTYSQQHKSELVSRSHGVRIIERLLQASNELQILQSLSEVSENSLLESQLEERFVKELEQWATGHDRGGFDRTVINGKQGYRLICAGLTWEIEVQPRIGKKDFVSLECNPDFLIRTTVAKVKPIAVFVDGYKYHVENNRLRDDVQKRRALLASNRFLVWSLNWDDITEGVQGQGTFPDFVTNYAKFQLARRHPKLDVSLAMRGGFSGLIAFLLCPIPTLWHDFDDELLTSFIGTSQKALADDGLRILTNWSSGNDLESSTATNDSTVQLTQEIAGTSELVALQRNNETPIVLLRVDDRHETIQDGAYKATWRATLHAMNLYQFADRFEVFAVSEVLNGGYTLNLAKEADGERKLSADWQTVADEAVSSLALIIDELCGLSAPIPIVEFFLDELPEGAAGELAWPDKKVAILFGDQWHLNSKWEEIGWQVVQGEMLARAESVKEAVLKFYLVHLQ